MALHSMDRSFIELYKPLCHDKVVIHVGEQMIGPKLEKEYDKAVYCHPAYLTYMQSTSCEMHGWMNHKLESRLLEKISATSDMQTIPL